jgi:acyl carrier protein
MSAADGLPASVRERIVTLVTSRLDLAPGLAAEHDLITSGALDSLGLVDLILDLERTFGLRINLETVELDNFRSVERMTAFVVREQSKAP